MRACTASRTPGAMIEVDLDAERAKIIGGGKTIYLRCVYLVHVPQSLRSEFLVLHIRTTLTFDPNHNTSHLAYNRVKNFQPGRRTCGRRRVGSELAFFIRFAKPCQMAKPISHLVPKQAYSNLVFIIMVLCILV